MELQRYVSPDLTHFVGRSSRNAEARFTLLKKIIRGGLLQARPRPSDPSLRNIVMFAKYVGSPLSSNDAYEMSMVCFCDIPLADLHLHMKKYGPFGIAFRKNFLATQGATPVMYVPQFGRPSIIHFRDVDANKPPKHGVASQAVIFNRFGQYLNKLHERISSSDDPSLIADWTKMSSFLEGAILSHFKFFDHRLQDDHLDNFYMEREWRSANDVRFSMEDIQRIVIPSRFAGRLRKAFRNYEV